MGAYDRGTIKMMCDVVRPKIGIVTGVNEQHLALFKSMDNLLSAEGGRELLQCLPEDGLIIANGENKYCRDLYGKAKIRKLIYSYSSVENIEIKKESVSFSVDSQHFQANVFGKHNILNLLAGILVAKELGMSLEEIAKAIDKIKTLFKVFKNNKGINIIDSTYSANPDGVMADLDYLKIYSGKKVIVMPCLIELGGAAGEVHQRIGKKIAEVCNLAIITAKEHFEDIKKSAIKNGMKESNIKQLSGADLIVENVKSFCQKDDSVLLEGRLAKNILEKLIR
jgi:UDP-N-acetylmuramoyl-tripeptide--D-alanyl-D-alanine ligase